MSWKLQKTLSFLALAAALFVTRSELFDAQAPAVLAQPGAPVHTAAR